MRGSNRGQSVLYAVLLMPMLFLVFALAIDVGALQLERLRLHYAVDLAAVTGASTVNTQLYKQTGEIELDQVGATAATRQYLLMNLAGLPDTPDPELIASSAEIAVVNQVPAHDPFTGVALDRPAVCVRIHVPHHFALLGWIGLTSGILTVTGAAESQT